MLGLDVPNLVALALAARLWRGLPHQVPRRDPRACSEWIRLALLGQAEAAESLSAEAGVERKTESCCVSHSLCAHAGVCAPWIPICWCLARLWSRQYHLSRLVSRLSCSLASCCFLLVADAFPACQALHEQLQALAAAAQIHEVGAALILAASASGSRVPYCSRRLRAPWRPRPWPRPM